MSNMLRSETRTNVSKYNVLFLEIGYICCFKLHYINCQINKDNSLLEFEDIVIFNSLALKILNFAVL